MIKKPEIARIDNPPQNGSCRGHDPRMWYPYASKTNDGTYGQRQREAQRASAKARSICSTCPVINECLAYAMYHEEHGIWGGTTEGERIKLRRKMGINLVPRQPHLPVRPISAE